MPGLPHTHRGPGDGEQAELRREPRPSDVTWVGALRDRCARSPILAAARGSLELISTGALISMERLWLAACVDLCVTLSAVKECRFLAFFLLSTRRWKALTAPVLPEVGPGAALAPVPGSEGTTARQPDAEAGPSLSISISCLAAALS